MKKRISVTIEESTYDELAKFVSSIKPRVSQSSIVDESIIEYIKFKQEENNERKETSSSETNRKKEARSKERKVN